MPTSPSPETGRYVCEACGRHFHTFAELGRHATECEAVKRKMREGDGHSGSAGGRNSFGRNWRAG